MLTLTPSYLNLEIGKLAGSLVTGAIVTFAIFVGMANLIESSVEPLGVKPTVLIGNIIYEESPIVTVPKATPKAVPKLTPPPQIAVIEDVAEPSFSNALDEWSPPVGVDEITLDKGLGSNGNAFATPIVRIDPTYPGDAARNGVEGWVKLGFSIAADGSVTDIVVLNAEPKRIFDREARKALSKWKYKPAFVQGSASEQTGMQVVLEFKINP